jgi:hypothetical protein
MLHSTNAAGNYCSTPNSVVSPMEAAAAAPPPPTVATTATASTHLSALEQARSYLRRRRSSEQDTIISAIPPETAAVPTTTAQHQAPQQAIIPRSERTVPRQHHVPAVVKLTKPPVRPSLPPVNTSLQKQGMTKSPSREILSALGAAQSSALQQSNAANAFPSSSSSLAAAGNGQPPQQQQFASPGFALKSNFSHTPGLSSPSVFGRTTGAQQQGSEVQFTPSPMQPHAKTESPRNSAFHMAENPLYFKAGRCL